MRFMSKTRFERQILHKRAVKAFETYESDFLSRNIFQRGDFPTATESLPAEPALNLELKGIFLGRNKKAMIFKSSDQQNFIVGEGDSVEAYQVKSIQSKSVILESDQGQQEIKLE